MFFFSLKALKYICASKQTSRRILLLQLSRRVDSYQGKQKKKKKSQIQYGSYRSTSIGTWYLATAIQKAGAIAIAIQKIIQEVHYTDINQPVLTRP